MPARLPVLVRGRARRSCRPAAATRRAPPRTLPHQGSLTHPVSCWHGLAPRLPSTRFIPTPLCTCPAPTPPPPRPQKVNHRTRRSRNDLRYVVANTATRKAHVVIVPVSQVPYPPSCLADKLLQSIDVGAFVPRSLNSTGLATGNETSPVTSAPELHTITQPLPSSSHLEVACQTPVTHVSTAAQNLTLVLALPRIERACHAWPAPSPSAPSFDPLVAQEDKESAPRGIVGSEPPQTAATEPDWTQPVSR